MTHPLTAYEEILAKLGGVADCAVAIRVLCQNNHICANEEWKVLTLQERKERIRTLMLKMYEELNRLEDD